LFPAVNLEKRNMKKCLSKALPQKEKMVEDRKRENSLVWSSNCRMDNTSKRYLAIFGWRHLTAKTKYRCYFGHF
jgi:hypothetical protein